MRTRLFRSTCRILLVCMASLSFHAHAGLIDTRETAAEPPTPRDAMLRFVDRTDVSRQLQALGVAPEAAQERVAALTASEAAELSARLAILPAGAEAGSGIVVLMVLAFLVYLFWREVIMDGVR